MHWIALQPEGAAQPGEPCDLTDPTLALGWWALHYTPRVAVWQKAVLLEVSTSARLWGGADALLQHILASNKPVAHISYAQGATSLIALAQLVVRPSSADQPQPARAVDDLPLSALAAARLHLDTLMRLGVRNWGQLRALPRDGVARRFGAELLAALDQAYGLRPDLYDWLVLPEAFAAGLELPAAVDTAPALLFAARRLLAQLQLWLQLRHQGVLTLELVWLMDPRRDTASQGVLRLGTAEPTQDCGHLQRLLAEHLAQVRLAAPVHTLRLRTLEVASQAQASASWLPDAVRSGEGLTQLVERLSARLGPHQVLQLQAICDHRPEQMQQWLPITDNLIAKGQGKSMARGQNDRNKSAMRKPAANGAWLQPLYPTWLLAQPELLPMRQQQPYYQGPLLLLSRPQRLESGWWGGGACALRDYFVARSPHAGLLWIYRERLGDPAAQAPAKWYLHGFFA